MLRRIAVSGAVILIAVGAGFALNATPKPSESRQAHSQPTVASVPISAAVPAPQAPITAPPIVTVQLAATQVQTVSLPEDLSFTYVEEPSVGDISDSLVDMARAADLIVIANVKSQAQYSPLAVASSLQISRVVKGTTPASPLVLQAGILRHPNAGVLQNGSTYFLFLGKQGDANPNTFFIKGGRQGIFTSDGTRLWGFDPSLVSVIRIPPGADPFVVLEGCVKEAVQ